MIRLHALHDDAGKITGLIAAPSDGPHATISVEPGTTLTEVEASGAGVDVAHVGGEIRERLLHVIEHCRVDRMVRGMIRRLSGLDEV